MRLKNLFFNLLIIIGLSFLIIACKNEPPPRGIGMQAQSNGQKTAFFDMKSYFKTEIERLRKDVKWVEKTVTINGKSETKKLENLNFEEELAPFMASDINRPAWSDYYLEKAQSFNNQGFRKEYYAQKDHLKTRSIVINKQGTDSKMTIQILNADETVATKAETHLSYDNHTGYTISTIQKLMGSEDTVKVDVKFLQN